MSALSSSQAISRFSIRRWLLYFRAGPPAYSSSTELPAACFARSYVWASPSNNSRLPFWKWKREKAMSPKLLGALQLLHAVVASKLHGEGRRSLYHHRRSLRRGSRRFSFLWVPKHTILAFELNWLGKVTCFEVAATQFVLVKKWKPIFKCLFWPFNTLFW